jgi:acyl-coenzyme A synthetase/AMP-(fatty) acid ligase
MRWHLEIVETPGVSGDLAIRAGWPSMFRGNLQEERYARAPERAGTSRETWR